MYVFVYGTLKAGFGNHRLLKGARFVSESTIKGYQMYSLRCFPAVIRASGQVTGEVYEIDPTHLAAMDCLEGNGSLYQRELIHVGGVKAWIYLYLNPSRLTKPVDSGIWCDNNSRTI